MLCLIAIAVCGHALVVPAAYGSDVARSASTPAASSPELFARFDAVAAEGLGVLHRVTPDPPQNSVAIYLTRTGAGRESTSDLPAQELLLLSAGGEEHARLQPPLRDPSVRAPAFAGAVVVPRDQLLRVVLRPVVGAGALSTEFAIPAGRAVVELLVTAPGNGGEVSLSATTWSTDGGRSLLGRVLERVGLGRDGNKEMPLSALTSRPDFRAAQGSCQGRDQWQGLRQLQAMRAEFSLPPEAYFHALVHCAISAGARPTAAGALEAWQQSLGVTPRFLAATAKLAELDFVRGDTASALQVLEGLPYRKMRTIDAAQAMDLHTRALLSLGRTEAAKGLLGGGPHLHLAELWELNELDMRKLDFLRINHAVTLLRSGRIDEGRAMLDMVGSRATVSTHGTALRDRANLMLAWNLLGSEHGEEAAAVFNRVSLDGPFAEAALLGRGWAAATGPSERVARAPIPGLQADNLSASGIRSLYGMGAIGCTEVEQLLAEAVENCPNREYFDKSKAPDYTEESLIVALAFWRALITDADPRSVPAVEAVIAMADAHQALGQSEKARSYLHEAEARINQNLQRLQQAQQQVAGRPTSIERYAYSVVERRAPDGGTAIQDAAYFLIGWGVENGNHELLSTLIRLDHLSHALQQQLRWHEQDAGADLLEVIGTLRAQVSGEIARRVLQEFDEIRLMYSGFEREVALKVARSHDPFLSRQQLPAPY